MHIHIPRYFIKFARAPISDLALHLNTSEAVTACSAFRHWSVLNLPWPTDGPSHPVSHSLAPRPTPTQVGDPTSPINLAALRDQTTPALLGQPPCTDTSANLAASLCPLPFPTRSSCCRCHDLACRPYLSFRCTSPPSAAIMASPPPIGTIHPPRSPRCRPEARQPPC